MTHDVNLQPEFFFDWLNTDGSPVEGHSIVTALPRPMRIGFAVIEGLDGPVGVVKVSGFDPTSGSRSMSAIHLNQAECHALQRLLSAFTTPERENH